MNASTFIPPHDEQAEAGVLVTILADWSTIPRVRAYLTAEDFYDLSYQAIYSAILDCAEPDPNVITAHLEASGRLDEAGGLGWFGKVNQFGDPAIGVESLAKIVKDYAMRRSMIVAAQNILRMASDAKTPVERAVECAQQEVRAINVTRSDTTMESNQAVTDRALSDLERALELGGRIPGIRTGIPWGSNSETQFDQWTGGWERGDLIVFAGRPGSGKTSAMMNSIYQAAIKDHLRVGMFSLEMKSARLMIRLASIHTGINGFNIRSGKLNDQDAQAVRYGMAQMYDASIAWKHVGDLTPSRMLACIEREAATRAFDLIVTDYLQLMEADGKNDNRSREIDTIGKELKAMASVDDGGFNVPIIVGSQMNRLATQAKTPGLEHMREGAIENPADKVIIFNVPDEDNPQLIDVMLRKNRDGATGTLNSYFDKTCFRFKAAEVRKR